MHLLEECTSFPRADLIRVRRITIMFHGSRSWIIVFWIVYFALRNLAKIYSAVLLTVSSNKQLTHWGFVLRPLSLSPLVQAMASSLPSHYLKQYWLIMGWKTQNKPQSDSNQKTYTFSLEILLALMIVLTHCGLVWPFGDIDLGQH